MALTLTAELLHRVLALLEPSDGFHALAAADRHHACDLRRPGPLWGSWLETFFGIGEAPCESPQSPPGDLRGHFRKLFTLREARWAQLSLDGGGGEAPAGREWFTASVVPGAHGGAASVLLYGGRTLRAPGRAWRSAYFGDLWRLSFDPPRESAAAACGQRVPYVRRARFQKVAAEGSGPGARAHHDACVLASRYLVIHGGLMPQGYRDNDTFVLDLGAQPPVWREVSAGPVQSPERPAARFHHSFTPLGDGRRAVLVGGHDRTVSTILGTAILAAPAAGDASVGVPPWDLAVDDASPGEKPMPRARHSAVALRDALVVVFGGNGGSDHRGASEHPEMLGDLWLLDADSRTWRELEPGDGPRPPARQYHSALMTSRAAMVVCGGCDWRGVAVEDNAAHWVLDLSSIPGTPEVLPAWQRVARSGCSVPPAPRLMPTLCEMSGYLVAFGGYGVKSFDNFGDPLSFAPHEADSNHPKDGLGRMMRGFHALAAPLALGGPWRSVGGGPSGGGGCVATPATTRCPEEHAAGFRACGILPLLDADGGLLVFAAPEPPAGAPTHAAPPPPPFEAFELLLGGPGPGELLPGSGVRLRGLQKKPALNGSCGALLQLLPGGSRCAVRLRGAGGGGGGGGEIVSVSLDNLEAVEEME